MNKKDLGVCRHTFFKSVLKSVVGSFLIAEVLIGLLLISLYCLILSINNSFCFNVLAKLSLIPGTVMKTM